MSMDVQAAGCDSQGEDAGTTWTEERLDAAIGQVLQSSFGAARPGPANWAYIRRRALRAKRKARKKKTSPFEDCTVRRGRCEMFSWNDVLAQQERYVDLRREAERERLVRHALNGSEKRTRSYRHVLAWLGQRLVAWGWRLQARYGPRAVAVHASSCQPCLVKR
jgi:hypothetical protein